MQLWVPAEVGALDAADKLTIKLQFGRYRRVVKADIKGFFGPNFAIP